MTNYIYKIKKAKMKTQKDEDDNSSEEKYFFIEEVEFFLLVFFLILFLFSLSTIDFFCYFFLFI